MTYSIRGYIRMGKRKVVLAYLNVEADSKEQAERAVLYEHPGAVIESCEEAV